MKYQKRTIMVIDPHPIIHAGLKTILAYEPDMEVVMTATSADEAMEQLDKNLPAVVIIDPSLCDSDGSCFVQQLRSKFPGLGILIYTMSERTLFVDRLAVAAADGYLMKTASPAVLKETIRALLAGEVHFLEELLNGAALKLCMNRKGSQGLIENLSKRELDVFKLIGLGMDTVSISKELEISRNTVDTHRINIKNKLKLPNGKALDRFAYDSARHGVFG